VPGIVDRKWRRDPPRSASHRTTRHSDLDHRDLRDRAGGEGGEIDFEIFGVDPYTAKPYVLFYTTKRVGGGVQDFDAIKLLKFAAS
jgi:hypothetical protein